jgi:hypothetical protein
MLAQAIVSFTTLELVNPGGTSSDIIHPLPSPKHGFCKGLPRSPEDCSSRNSFSSCWRSIYPKPPSPHHAPQPLDLEDIFTDVHGLIITTHDHCFSDLASILSATAKRVPHNLLTRRNGVQETDGVKATLTFSAVDSPWSRRDLEELVRDIYPVILEGYEADVIAQRRNSDRAGMCCYQSETDSTAFVG